mmetsp:Transcript_32003/g.99151  ORF Transcript_32003/g.99151 Transcript_32003/m.99151 type:complete len:84 (+) Transcript_32003:2-253(+)
MPMLRAAVAAAYRPDEVAIVDDNDSFDGSDERLDWAAEAASVATLFRREPLVATKASAFKCHAEDDDHPNVPPAGEDEGKHKT